MGVALAVTSSLFQTYSQNQALIAQGKANQQQAQNYLLSMNYSFQNLEQQRHDAFEATIAELENIRIQGNRLESSVSAAVNEGMEGGGRTADLIKRASQADTNRAVVASKANYRAKSNEIDLNKEAALINTKQQIGSIQDVEQPSIFGTLLGVASAYYNARTHNEQIQLMRDKAMISGNKAMADTSNVVTAGVASVASSATGGYFSMADWEAKYGFANRNLHSTFDYRNPVIEQAQQNYFW